MSNATSVSSTAVEVDATTVDATPDTTMNVTTLETFITKLQQLEDENGSNRDKALVAFGQASIASAGERIAKLKQAKFSQSQLYNLLDGLKDIETDANYLPSVTDQNERKATAKAVRHYVAAFLVQSLDANYNAIRLELCGDEGFGIYAEGGPLGFAGLGAGVISKEKVDGRTVVKRTGAGVYLRADHLFDTATPVECLA